MKSRRCLITLNCDLSPFTLLADSYHHKLTAMDRARKVGKFTNLFPNRGSQSAMAVQQTDQNHDQLRGRAIDCSEGTICHSETPRRNDVLGPRSRRQQISSSRRDPRATWRQLIPWVDCRRKVPITLIDPPRGLSVIDYSSYQVRLRPFRTK